MLARPRLDGALDGLGMGRCRLWGRAQAQASGPPSRQAAPSTLPACGFPAARCIQCGHRWWAHLADAKHTLCPCDAPSCYNLPRQHNPRPTQITKASAGGPRSPLA